MCWGRGLKTGDANRLNKLVRNASSVIEGGTELDVLGAMARRRMLTKLVSILNITSHHPLHDGLVKQKSTFSNGLISPECSNKQYRRSFLPVAIKLPNSSPLCRNMGSG